MALSSELEKALNQQLNGEYYSSYLYLQMAANFEQEDLPGMSSWMRTQASKEREVHAMKFFDHILQRDGVLSLTEISAPPGRGVRLAAGGVRVRAWKTSSSSRRRSKSCSRSPTGGQRRRCSSGSRPSRSRRSRPSVRSSRRSRWLATTVQRSCCWTTRARWEERIVGGGQLSV